MTDSSDIGALTAALAKAQGSFGPVKRDKKVTVQKKAGGSYSFSYAPLESILEATRQPLADNGLVVVQMLDMGSLVTMLLHESGQNVVGSVTLPQTGDIKEMGSAITYLRRYAIQALLGIAAEDDDDGSRAVGDMSQPVGAEKPPELLGNIQKTGTLVKGNADAGYGGEYRENPDGSHAIGLRLKLAGEDRDIPQVLITGPVGEGLMLAHPDPIGLHVTVKGKLYGVSAKGRATYYRLVIGEYPDSDFIETPDVRIPAPPTESPAGTEEPAGDSPPIAPGQVPFDLSDEELQ